MSRKSSGLRNRYRTGKGTYHKLRKNRVADYYGTWVNGRCTEAERIGRHLRAVNTEYVEDVA